MREIPQMEPWFDEAEADAVAAYLQTGGWLTEFAETRAFEQEVALFLGVKHCVATNNGTIALAMALLSGGVGVGDEVIVPNFTMIATPNAAKLIGAKPIFVDVEPAALSLDPDLVAQAITPHTKALIYVPINGRAQGLTDIQQLCRQHGIFFIEDAAQAFGSKVAGQYLGTFGDLSTLSFGPLKIISMGQGGAVVTNDDAVAATLRRLKDFGRARGGNDIHDTIGYNFKITDLQAVVGRQQLKKLAWRIKRKKAIYGAYEQLLKDVPAVEMLSTDLAQTCPWFIDIYVDEPEHLQAHLKENNIVTRRVYPAITTQRAYLSGRQAYQKAGNFPVTERCARRGLWLPSASQLTDEDITRVCLCIADFYQIDRQVGAAAAHHTISV